MKTTTTQEEPMTDTPELLAEVTVNDLTVRIEHIIDPAGDHAIQLTPVNCRLTGELPGLYYPEPLDADETAGYGIPVR
jgi:hypothetical protein